MSGGVRPPTPDECSTAHKILTGYSRLARKYNVQLPAKVKADLDQHRTQKTITIGMIPPTLRRKWPGVWTT